MSSVSQRIRKRDKQEGNRKEIEMKEEIPSTKSSSSDESAALSASSALYRTGERDRTLETTGAPHTPCRSSIYLLVSSLPSFLLLVLFLFLFLPPFPLHSSFRIVRSYPHSHHTHLVIDTSPGAWNEVRIEGGPEVCVYGYEARQLLGL